MVHELENALAGLPDRHADWVPVPGEPGSVRADYTDEIGPLIGPTGGGASRTGFEWRAWLED